MVKDSTAKLYIDNHEQPSLVVTDLWQGPDLRGSVGISVGTELGTEGYFRDLKITIEDWILLKLFTLHKSHTTRWITAY